MKLLTYLHLVPRLRIVELTLHFPIRLHDVFLTHLNTGITLLSSRYKIMGNYERIC